MTTRSDAGRFTHGTALITGAGSGIGEGLARQLGGRGMTVLVVDVDLERAEAVAAGVRAAGGDARAHAVDVTDASAMERLALEVFEHHGSLELLVNNAGIETGGRVWEVEPARWRHMMAVNVDGVFHGIAAFVPKMIAQGSAGTVANVSSIGGFTTMAHQGAYITSKHAVVGLSECLFHDVAEVGASLQVSVILPGWVRTRIFADAGSHAPEGDSGDRFENLRVSNLEHGLDPLDAAKRMIDGLARGDFWVFTDESGPARMRGRGEQLMAGGLPAQP